MVIVTILSLTRDDLAGEIAVLAGAYRGRATDLATKDPSADTYVQDIIRLGWEVTSEDLNFADSYVDAVISDPATAAKHQEAVDLLGQALRNAEARGIEIFGGIFLNTLERYLGWLAEEIHRANRNLGKEESVRNRLDRRVVQSLLVQTRQIQLTRRLEVATRSAESSAKDAEEAAKNARDQAGYAAGSELTKQFDELAVKEQETTQRFRWLTAILVAVGVLGSLLLNPGDQTTTAQAIFRVALLAGVLGLATYFGRQAAHHRDLATWARTIKVQLLTFDGYVTPVIENDLRDQMRVAFAARVFGSSPENKDDGSATLTVPLLHEALALLSKTGAAAPKQPSP